MTRCGVGVLAALILCWPSAAFSLTGQEILKKIDDNLNQYKDRSMLVEMIVVESNGAKRVSLLAMLQKGSKRIVFFRSGLEKGRGVLTLGTNKMFIYLPSYHKVRRVAAHARGQSFMGSDLTMEDISVIRYSDDYDAKLVKTTATHYTIELTPKKHFSSAWKRMIWVVKKNPIVMEKMDYFDGQNRLRKTWTREQYKLQKGNWLALLSTMIDHNRKHRTIMKVSSVEFDTGLRERLFTKKGLVRGR